MSLYLVTGAAGFIGSAVAKKLISQGHQVITIDNLSTGCVENIPEGVEFIEGNIQDNAIVSKLETKKIEAILHIAGQSSGEVSFDNPVYDLQTNCQSTLLLLDLALKTGCERFVYASTMSIYGEQPDQPVNENYTPKPKSFYAVGKLASENYLKIYNQHYGLSTCSLRLFNVYGVGQNMNNLRQGMVSIFLAQALNDGKVVVKGSKDRYRDFIYINDVVNVFIQFLGAKDKCKAYNIATGQRTTVEELLNIIEKLLPYKIDVKYSGSTPGDQFGLYADIGLIKKELGWQPTTTLSDGLTMMVDWQLEK